MNKWVCMECGLIYAESDGIPEEGIEPGTLWDELTDSWDCPDCQSTKSTFEIIESSVLIE